MSLNSPLYTSIETLFHHGIWDAFDRTHHLNVSTLQGSIIADFRGFVCCPTEKEYTITKATAKLKAKTESASTFIPPNMRIYDRPVDTGKFFLNNSNVFWPFLGLTKEGDYRPSGPAAKSMQESRKEADIILCKMLDGTAVYGSTLGNPDLSTRPRSGSSRGAANEPSSTPLPASGTGSYVAAAAMPRRSKEGPADDVATDKDTCEPITYFLIYDGTSKHQLGYLVQRIHRLAELRILALIDRQSIIERSRRIIEIGEKITNLILKATTTGDIVFQELNDAIQEYNDIGNSCHGGLLFRTSRSKYYVDVFYERLGDVGAESVGGWQSYSEFIYTHFDQIYQSTRSIGERYREAGQRIDRLISIYHVERQKGLSLVQATMSVIGISITSTAVYSAMTLFHFDQTSAIIAATVTPACAAGLIWLLYRKIVP